LPRAFSTVGITLISGRTYEFRVESRNLVGYSDYSLPIQVLAAQVPNKPDSPKTTISGNFVAITWTQPFDGASPITSYTIRIRQGDNTVFTAEPNSCDGTNPAVVGQLSCAVPISTLKATPYSLDWGVPVYVIVSAVNIVGPSVFSDKTLDAEAAIILTNPDAPKNLVNVPTITSATKVGLSWTIGDKNGGSPVIDYTVSKALGSGSYEVY